MTNDWVHGVGHSPVCQTLLQIVVRAVITFSPPAWTSSAGMEISAEKTKLMTNNASGINTEIKVNGQKLEAVTSFKYLGSVITDEGSKPEVLSRITQTTAALTRLKPV